MLSKRLLLNIQSPILQNLRMGQFVPQTKMLLIADHQQGFKCRNSTRYDPSNIRDGEYEIGRRKRQIANDGFLEAGRILRLDIDRVQAGYTFANAASARKTIADQDVR